LSPEDFVFAEPPDPPLLEHAKTSPQTIKSDIAFVITEAYMPSVACQWQRHNFARPQRMP
jgi:hypothetical protein